MDIGEYPILIENSQREVIAMGEAIHDLTWGLQLADDHIVEEVLTAIDTETGKLKYTNDKARELAANKLRYESVRWNAARFHLNHALTEKAKAQALVERLRNEFKIALADKLNAKFFFSTEIAE